MCLEELNEISDQIEGNTWKAKLRDTLVLYLGEDAAITLRLDNLHFTKKTINTHTATIKFSQKPIFALENKKNFEILIISAMNHIKLNGIKADYIKSNFLSQFKTVQILSGIFALATLIYWIGWFVGNTQKVQILDQIEQKRVIPADTLFKKTTP